MPDSYFGPVLPTIGPSEESNHPEVANRREIEFHHVNPSPHTSIVIRQKFRELDSYILQSGPDTKYLSMANVFAGEKFASREACKNRLSPFFDNRG